MTEVRFVLNVKFGFEKIMTFNRELTESFPLYGERLFPGPPTSLPPLSLPPPAHRPRKRLRLVNISTVWF